jgi:seryl-tRNA synthetase
MGKVAAVSLVIETKDTAKRLAEIDFELDSIGKKLREAKKAGQQDVYAGLKSQQAALRNEAREVNKALRDQSLAFQQAAKSIPKDSSPDLQRSTGNFAGKLTCFLNRSANPILEAALSIRQRASSRR